jgi:hypothetical protein
MMAINKQVLESQLEIVHKKMSNYENELFTKIENKIKLINFDFEANKRETLVRYFHNFHKNKFRLIQMFCIMN